MKRKRERERSFSMPKANLGLKGISSRSLPCRGHGALLGACDTTIKVESLAACRTATVDKANDGPDDQKVAFDLKSVELHFDAETDTHTTRPVVIRAESPVNIPRGPTLTPNQTTMLNLIGDAMPRLTSSPLVRDSMRRASRSKSLSKRSTRQPQPAGSCSICSALSPSLNAS